MAIDLDVHGNTKPLEAAVQAAVNRIRRQPIKITVDDKGATQPLGNMKRGADEFTKSMEAANARILAFGASMAIINGVANAFKGMVKNLVEVEKAMADVNVVMGLSAQNLEKFSDGLFKVAKETGAAFRVAADAATEYARQGLGVEESLKRTRDALVLTRLTGMDSAEAVKSLTAAMNTYGTQIKDTTQLVSKFAAVDVKFAVSAQDFADAISRTGQSAQSAGVSIDELVGIVTAAQQKTARGGAVIGNALKTIFTKTGKTDTLNQLENLGIAVRDLEGNTIGAQRILNDLANTFDTLSAAQKAQITQTMGGLFHINILKAVLSDAAKQNGIMAEATRISAGATDEAIQKNEELRKTMSAVATETGLAIKQVSTQIGEIALAPGMEKILNSVKSLAEGLSGVLGDGESTGSSFATGLLKGIGNVITGPGLVVLAGVFFKLFGQALKFTKESLTSLVGVTTEKQKQKAIQTSLVALFGQNAALNKEMLRTDIGRTEKEKIILGLLKAQVVEANSLNKLTAGMAGTLYRKGYGANLTPVGKKASGHIPNYANPERAQAAQGGYAAGNIRSMNMPGEGSVIYNSAEKVKNFKGMSQPAIMPPHSSKAGKNYQQAFGSIHGFDPYAAGGYIPNFARGGKGVGAKPRIDLSNPAIMQEIDKKTKYLNAGSSEYIGLSASLGPDKPKQTFYVAGGSGTDSGIYNKKGRSFYKKAAMQKAQPRKIDVEFKSLDEKDERRGLKRYDDEINSKLQKRSAIIASGMLKTFGYGSMNSAVIEKDLPKSKMATVAGHIFEAVTKSVLRSVGESAKVDERPDNALIDLPPNKKLYELFEVGKNQGSEGAEAKINTNLKNVMGFARKIYSSDPTTKTPLDLKSLPKKGKAYGHIPNFADPLSDAIGREKSAGVPVSQIRVGSHGALMGKGNPLGLGVTNTHDEPNGLRDVFGANGFVPNYFNPLDGIKSSIANTKFGQNWEKATTEHTKKIEKLNRRIEQREQAIQKHNQELSTLTKGTSEYRAVQSKLKSTTSNLDKTRAKLSVLEKSSATGIGGKMGRFSSGLGRAFSGNAGMAMMIGAPMAAGFLQQGGMGAQGGNQSMYAAGGALSGAASGAMMASMIAPMFGPGAPLVIALGGAVGAYQGWASATEENTKALKDAELKRQQGVISSFVGTSPKFIQAFSKNIFDDMSQEGKQLMKMAAPKYTATTPPDINEKDFLIRGPNNPIFKMKIPLISDFFGPSAEEIDQISKYREQGDQQNEFQNVQQYQVGSMKKAVESMGDEKFLFPSYTRDKKGKIQQQGQPELQKSSDFLKNLEKIDFFKVDDTEDVKRIEALRSQLYKIYQEQITAEHDQSEAIILQLNIQKAMIESQKAAAQAQFDIKKGYLERGNILEQELKLMGGFISEEQKARMKYVQGLNKAGEAYDLARVSAESTKKQGLINLINTDADLEQKLKISLYKEKLKAEEQAEFQKQTPEEQAAAAKQVELTDELIKKEADRLKKILKQNGATEDQIDKILNIYSQSELNLQLAGNELDLKEQKLHLDKQTNVELGKQAGAMRVLIAEAEKLKDKAQFDIDLNQQQERIRRALYQMPTHGRGIYRSQDENIAFDRAQLEARIGLQKQSRLAGSRSAITSKFKELNLDPTGLSINDMTSANIVGRTKKMAQERIDELNKGKGSASTDEQAEINRQIAEYQNIIDGKKNDILDKVKSTVTEQSRLNQLQEANNDASRAELELREKILKYKRGEALPGDDRSAMSRGIGEGMDSIREKVQYMDYELGEKIPGAFADGLAGAMTEAINGTKSIKEGLMDAAVGFLGMIQQAMMQKMAYQMVGAMGFSKGGNVRKYSKGGGVPAMVSNGEYVMSRDAVNKYGGSFMHGMNAGGSIPGFADGGEIQKQKIPVGGKIAGTIISKSLEAKAKQEAALANAVENDLLSKGKIRREGAPGGPAAQGSALASNFGGGRGFDSGRLYQRKAMSGAFYAQSGNVGLGEDTSAIQSILSEEERIRQEAEAKRQAKKAKRRQLLGMVASIGLMYGLGKMDLFGTEAGPKITAPKGMTTTLKRFDGGPIRKYASGGHIAGKSGIDQIPAMLSEGEYVIRASSARQIGKPMLDQINAGKFYDGGAVSKIAGSSETGSTGGNTNNISISINMERGSSNQKQQKENESSGQNPADRSNDEQSNAQLAERIKQQVVSVIVEEQRPGGLLSD